MSFSLRDWQKGTARCVCVIEVASISMTIAPSLECEEQWPMSVFYGPCAIAHTPASCYVLETAIRVSCSLTAATAIRIFRLAKDGDDPLGGDHSALSDWSEEWKVGLSPSIMIAP